MAISCFSRMFSARRAATSDCGGLLCGVAGGPIKVGSFKFVATLVGAAGRGDLVVGDLAFRGLIGVSSFLNGLR